MLLSRHVIDLLHQVNVIQMINKIIQIQNLASDHLCNLLADQLIEFLMDRKRIKVVHHINILIKDSAHIVTKENDYISTLDFRNLDEIATTFMDCASNEMARTKYINRDSNQSKNQSPSANKYPLLTQFGMTKYLLNPTGRDTIFSILRDIENLNSDHNLSFVLMKSTTAEPFLIPNFIFQRSNILTVRGNAKV